MDAEWQGRRAARNTSDKQAWAIAEQRARKEELRRQEVVDEEESSARKQLELANGRAAAAESAAGGLRGEINRLLAGHSATYDAIATQQRQAGESAVMVLGRLLEEAGRMAGSLAEAFERSRIAGQACLSGALADQSGEVLPHSSKGMEEAGHMRRICLFSCFDRKVNSLPIQASLHYVLR